MKRFILTAVVLTTLSVSAVHADNLQPVSPVPAQGSPGTATPTPYPQVVPPSTPKAGGTQGNSPLLPRIEMPRPPKDQALPTVESGPADKDTTAK